MNVSRLFAIGSYTSATEGRGTGIHLVTSDHNGDDLHVVSSVAGASPSFLAWRCATRTLYSADETAAGTVSAFRLTGENHLAQLQLERLGSWPSSGGRPCHLAIHPSGRWLAVSNYAGGTFTVLPIGPDGALGEPTSRIEHRGTGIHPTRQATPHPHTVLFSADGLWAVLLDVALDTLSVHAFNEGRFSAEPVAVAHCTPRSGPRHAVWLSTAKLAVDEEISGTLSTFHWSGDGRLDGPLTTVSTRIDGADDGWPSELQLDETGKLLVANRVPGTLSTFTVTDGHPVCTGEIALPSANVRHFWSDGSVALAALQDTDQLVLIDLRSESVRSSLSLGSPAHVLPLADRD